MLNCPERVLCDQRLRVRCRAFERRKIRRVARIAQRDAYIAKKASALNSFDRRILEKLAELRIGELQVFP